MYNIHNDLKIYFYAPATEDGSSSTVDISNVDLKSLRTIWDFFSVLLIFRMNFDWKLVSVEVFVNLAGKMQSCFSAANQVWTEGEHKHCPRLVGTTPAVMNEKYALCRRRFVSYFINDQKSFKKLCETRIRLNVRIGLPPLNMTRLGEYDSTWSFYCLRKSGGCIAYGYYYT